jgi:hypothetical protein
MTTRCFALQPFSAIPSLPGWLRLSVSYANN